METTVVVPQKVKHSIIPWPSNSTLKYVPKKNKNVCHQELIHGYSQQRYSEYSKSESSSVSMNGYSTYEWIRTCGLSIQWNIILPLKSMEMNLDNIIPSEKSLSQQPCVVWFHLSEMGRIVKFIETKSRSMVAKDWWWEMMGGDSSWEGVPSEMDERDQDDGCATLCIY